MTRANDHCIFLCGQKSTRKGEHVIPEWFRSWMHEQYGGPYTHKVNGQTVPRRDKTTAWSEGRPLAHTIPCCEEHNQVLNDRFEGAKDSVIAFLKGAPADQQCALWLLKTSLLFWHPECELQSDVPFHLLEEPTRPEREALESNSNVLYDWMVTGHEPPEWVALWIAGTLEETPGLLEPLDTPAWSWEGDTYTPVVRSFGFASVDFQLSYHPGYVFEHPSLQARLVWPLEFDDVSQVPDVGDSWRDLLANTHRELIFGEDAEHSPLSVPIKMASSPPYCRDPRIIGQKALPLKSLPDENVA